MSTQLSELFGPVIHSYTRQQALEDGYLVDVSETAAEAGIRFPVALTRAVWEDCVAWDEADNKRQTYQDESGRLWDVVLMLRFAILRLQKSDTNAIQYQIVRVPRGGRGRLPRRVVLKAHIGPGDNGEPVITVMQPQED